MNEDMMTEAERASKLAEPAANDTPTRGKGVFYVHTLGCQMNVHDSERIAGVLEADGYVPATSIPSHPFTISPTKRKNTCP